MDVLLSHHQVRLNRSRSSFELGVPAAAILSPYLMRPPHARMKLLTCTAGLSMGPSPSLVSTSPGLSMNQVRSRIGRVFACVPLDGLVTLIGTDTAAGHRVPECARVISEHSGLGRAQRTAAWIDVCLPRAVVDEIIILVAECPSGHMGDVGSGLLHKAEKSQLKTPKGLAPRIEQSAERSDSIFVRLGKGGLELSRKTKLRCKRPLVGNGSLNHISG